MSYSILMLDDDGDDIYLYRQVFTRLDEQLQFFSLPSMDELMQHYPEQGNADLPVPNLILLDMNLPKYNGLAIYEFIQRNPLLQQVPTLILTTSSSPLDMADCKNAGIHSYFTKPMDYTEVVAMAECIYGYWFKHNRLGHSERSGNG